CVRGWVVECVRGCGVVDLQGCILKPFEHHGNIILWNVVLFQGRRSGEGGDSSARRRHQKGHRICVNSLLSTKYDDVGNVLCQGESKNERHPFLRKPVCFESSTKCSHKHLPNF